MYAKTRLWLAGCTLSLSVLSGCTLEKKDDGADAFRDAVPQSTAIALSGPSAGAATSTAAQGPSRRTLGTGSSAPYAKWYGFTRDMRDGVNGVTAVVLGSIVWTVMRYPPTSLTADTATWGPWREDPLAPASYRFRITRVAADEYDYVLEGRSKTSTSDADYQAVLTGHGYGLPHALHGQGTFSIDLDAAKSLDPERHPNDSGSVTIVHELPHDFAESPEALPRTITATVAPAGDAHYTVQAKAELDHTGSIQVDAHVDIDDSHATKLEDVVIKSRWAASGAGRAEIDIQGGDLPASISKVDAVQCWGSDFTQSYYKDSVDFAPPAGDASACVYSSE